MKIIGQNIGPQQTLDYTDEKIEPQQRGPFVNCVFFLIIKQKTITAFFPPKKPGKENSLPFVLSMLYTRGPICYLKELCDFDKPGYSRLLPR